MSNQHEAGALLASSSPERTCAVGAHENHREAAAQYLATYCNGNPLLAVQGGVR